MSASWRKLWKGVAAIACLLPQALRLGAFDLGLPPLLESDLRETAQQSFDSAWLIKPPESGDTNNLCFRLAPILVHEALPGSGTNTAGSPSEPSQLLRRVFTAERAGLVGGKPVRQLTFFWRPAAPSSSESGRASIQGVVITVDADGWPVLTEIGIAAPGVRVFFVTERLERAAGQEFGAALSRRTFAIERSPRASPEVVVPRVIQDGPLPMGPMVYVSRDQRTVTTVVCRCMPSQLKSVEGARNYELIEAGWPPELAAEARPLADCLRLPGTGPTLYDELDSFEPGGRRAEPVP